MTKPLALVLAGLLLSGAAQAATSNVTARTFGIDGMSCADWTASPAQMRDGRAFILGYWAASNRANAKNPHVGARSNTEDVLGAVYRACTEGHVDSLTDATAQTYRRFEREGR